MENKGFIVNKEFDVSILKTVLSRLWWVPVFLGLIAMTGAYLYLRYTKPLYESSMIIQVEEQDNAKEILNVENINIRQNDLSATIELMRSELMFERAIKRLNYNVSLFSKGQVLTEEKYNSSTFNVQPYQLKDSTLIGVPIFVDLDNDMLRLNYSHNGRGHTVQGKLNERIETAHFDIILKSANTLSLLDDARENELFFTFNSLRSFSGRLRSDLQINTLDPVAKTIQVSFRGSNPQLCKDIVDAVAEAFLTYEEDIQRRSSEKIITFIDQQLDSIGLELRSSKDSLMDYQRRSNMPDPETASSSITAKITQLQEKLYVYDDEIRSLNYVDQKLRSEPNRLEVYRLLPEMLGKSYEPTLAGQVGQLYDLLEKKDDLLYQVTEGNAEIRSLNTKIQTRLNSIRKSIATILERLYASSKLVRAEIAGFESDYFELPEKKMEFSRLKNIQDLNEKYFSLLTEKKFLYAISDAGYSSNNRVLSRPVVNSSPVTPNRNLTYGIYVFLGLFLGLIIIALRYLTYNEINRLEDLEKLLPSKVTFLGAIPNVKKDMIFSQLIVHRSPKSVLSENMRKIRTNLSYIHPSYQTIAITSSISGEGKTFVALNIAGIIAMSGKKTIILDLDMRKPKIHIGMNSDNEYGMSTLIVGHSSLEQCVKSSEIEGLDFITAGPVPPNPSELLLSKRFREIQDELKEIYDVIIIDNPPIGLVSDGVRIMTESDIPIYVFKANYSKRNFALRVKELFEMKQIDRLNVVLNSVDLSQSKYGYDYGYGYYEEEDGGKQRGIFSKLKFFRK
jgi:tyrosine-protein kinase Etk/Wzc